MPCLSKKLWKMWQLFFKVAFHRFLQCTFYFFTIWKVLSRKWQICLQSIKYMFVSSSFLTAFLSSVSFSSFLLQVVSEMEFILGLLWYFAQGSTISYVACVHTLALNDERMILDMRTLTRTLNFSQWFFKVLNFFLVLIISYCWKTYCSTFEL